MEKGTIKTSIPNLVSIVVPTYNCGDFLREFIHSVLTQTYCKWELIIVDDGSTDSTSRMMADEFADDRITYCKRPDELRKGAPSCRNYGKSKAKGEFICFFDADDWVFNTCLEKRVAYIRETGADCCIFPSGIFTTNPRAYKKTHIGVPSGVDTLTSFLSNYYQYAVWTNIYKTKALKDIRWDERLVIYQDFDFSVQCICKGLSFRFSDAALPDYLYRDDGCRDTISKRNVTDAKMDSTIYLFNKVLESLEGFTGYARYRKDFIQYHLWYYIQAMREGNKNHEKRFLLHVESVYGKRIANRFKVICPLLSRINRKQRRRFVAMVAYYIFFRPSMVRDIYRILKVYHKINA